MSGGSADVLRLASLVCGALLRHDRPGPDGLALRCAQDSASRRRDPHGQVHRPGAAATPPLSPHLARTVSEALMREWPAGFLSRDLALQCPDLASPSGRCRD
eukprot:2605259-Rhodomonas_salina.3